MSIYSETKHNLDSSLSSIKLFKITIRSITMPYKEGTLTLPKSYQPRPHDVIFKNGTFLSFNAGNHKICIMIIENCVEYENCETDNEKIRLIYNMINRIIRGKSNQGIFVQRDDCSKDQWKMMTIRESFSKIESALKQMRNIDSSESKTEQDESGTGLRGIARLLETQRKILKELLEE